ncbi:MAG: hypothetical protein IPF88_13555 [Candidatus Microthrix sp.]|nr:hypothetical protein [Candidatus Microthrix sp.]MBK6439574.1 hypothetical protein [Candidatus Microthrix sp.]
MVGPAALAPAAALDAAWALINGPPAHVIAQTLALPAHAAALAALPAAALAPGCGHASSTAAALAARHRRRPAGWGLGRRAPTGRRHPHRVLRQPGVRAERRLGQHRGDAGRRLRRRRVSEVTPDYLRQLAGLEGCYTEVVSTSRDDALGAAMFARVEVRNATIESAAGSPTPSADVVAGDGTVVRVLGVHTTPNPRGGPVDRPNDRLAAMGQEADARGGGR